MNRIWQGHFGEGIVRTANNFGIVGERPSHPELLDWLASEFITQGWSVKHMHRLIMLSSAYQMSSETTPEKVEKDADNRLLSRFAMRRMTVEEIRDSLLQLDGTLDLTMGGTLQTGDRNGQRVQRWTQEPSSGQFETQDRLSSPTPIQSGHAADAV